MADDDPLLAKARALTVAAKKTSEMFLQFGKSSTEKEMSSEGINSLHDRTSSSPLKENGLIYRASVIHGSTLINTHIDIRNIAKRGDFIYIDGHQVKIALKGEWASNRIELEADFEGETNFEAVVSFDSTAFQNISTLKPKKKACPVATEDIHQAISQLSEVNELCLKFKKEEAEKVSKPAINSANEKKRKQKKSLRLSPEELGNDFPVSKFTQESPVTIIKSKELANKTLKSNIFQEQPIIASAPNNYSSYVNIRLPPLNSAQSTVSNNSVGDKSARSDNSTKNIAQNVGNGKIYGELTEKCDNEDGDEGPVQALLNYQKNRVWTEDPAIVANRRVKQKLKDDHKKKLAVERDQELLRRATIEASELKVHELKEKTLARVARYKEELARREQETKEALTSEAERKKEKEMEISSEEKKLKMLAVRREARERLLYHQRADILREQQKEDFIQQQLDAIAKKFEAPLPLPLHDKHDKGKVLEQKKAEVTFAIVGEESALSAVKPSSRNGKTIKRDTVCKTKREDKKNLLPSIVVAPTDSRKGGAVLAEPPVPVLRSRSEQQSRTKRDDLQMGSAGQVVQTSSSAHSTTKHADSDSDSWNHDDLLEVSIEFHPKNVTSSKHPTRPNLPQPSHTTNTSKINSTRSKGVDFGGNSRPDRTKVEDDSDDGALSDITPEKSPSKVQGRHQQQQRIAVGTNRKFTKESDITKRIVEDDLTFQPSIITKTSSTSAAKVWRKLKPIPIAPYVPVT